MSPRKTLLGFDLGGTKSAIALYDAKTFEELAHEKIPTMAKKGLEAVLETAADLIEKMTRPDTEAIGIGMPGLISDSDGIVATMHNIPGSENFPAKAFLEKRLGRKISIGNDASAFALAEAVAGAGKGKRVVIGVTLGTGVGGGIVIDGTLFSGSHGFAGEIGHMLLVPGKPPYPTEDKRGDVEQFLSGTSLGHRCTAAKRPEDYLDGEVCSFLHPEVATEVAWMLASLTHLVDPDIVVFGGSTGRALQPLFPAIHKELGKWVLKNFPLPELAVAKRKDAGTLGAALLTRRA